MYRYILRELCSQFDSLPLTSLTIPVATLYRVGVDASRAFVAGSTALNRPADAASGHESHMPETDEQCAVAAQATRLLARGGSPRR